LGYSLPIPRLAMLTAAGDDWIYSTISSDATM